MDSLSTKTAEEAPLTPISEETMLAAPPIESHGSSARVTLKNGVFFASQVTKNLTVNGELYHSIYVHLVDQQQSAMVVVLKSRFEEAIPNFGELNTAERACFRVDIMGVDQPSSAEYPFALSEQKPRVAVYMKHPHHQFKCHEYTHFPSQNMWERFGRVQIKFNVSPQQGHSTETNIVNTIANETRRVPNSSNMQSDDSEEVKLREENDDKNERSRGSANKSEIEQLRGDSDNGDVEGDVDNNGSSVPMNLCSDQTGGDRDSSSVSTNIAANTVFTATARTTIDLFLKDQTLGHVDGTNNEMARALVNRLDRSLMRAESLLLESQEELRNDIGTMNLGGDAVNAGDSAGGRVGNNDGNEEENREQLDQELEEEKHQEKKPQPKRRRKSEGQQKGDEDEVSALPRKRYATRSQTAKEARRSPSVRIRNKYLLQKDAKHENFKK